MNINNKEFFEEITRKIKSEKRNTKYDVLIPFSGGKDGSFLLWLFSKYTDLRILALHIDNWYMKKEARENVEKICKKVGCELVTVRPDWKHTQDIYRKLMMLKGEICMACDMMISIYPFKCAVKNNIPYIAWDLNPNMNKCKKINTGYIYSGGQYYDNTVKFYGEMINSIYKSDAEFGNEVKEVLLCDQSIKEHGKFPTFVNPFYWIGYDSGEVDEIVTKELDWVKPFGSDGVNSKCDIKKLQLSLKNKLDNKIIQSEFNRQTIADLGIGMSESELIENINNAKIDLILKLGANLRQ